jgi:hypothetical protein
MAVGKREISFFVVGGETLRRKRGKGRTESEGVDGVRELSDFVVDTRARTCSRLIRPDTVRQPLLQSIQFRRRKLLNSFTRFLYRSSVIVLGELLDGLRDLDKTGEEGAEVGYGRRRVSEFREQVEESYERGVSDAVITRGDP